MWTDSESSEWKWDTRKSFRIGTHFGNGRTSLGIGRTIWDSGRQIIRMGEKYED